MQDDDEDDDSEEDWEIEASARSAASFKSFRAI